MNINKAEQVEQVYDETVVANYSSQGCYRKAVETANELGGIEVFNSNDGNSSWSCAPIRTFEFDDASSAQVTCGGVFVIAYQPFK